jgi:peptidoglycan hydrolase CwlO-like protein
MRFPTTGNTRWLLPAALLLAVLCLTAAADAPAKTLGEKLQDTRGKLDKVRASESSLTETIAEQNRAIDSMIGEVSELRRRQAAVQAELSEKQSELERATEELLADKRRLARIRARLHRALDVLRERLVAIYEAGTPDMLNVVLESRDWSQLSARAGYLSQVQDYDDAVAGRVKGLRDRARAAVRRMAAARLEIKRARDAIAAKEREVASGGAPPPRRVGRQSRRAGRLWPGPPRPPP